MLQYSFPLFKAILIGFCYCTAIAANFPRIPTKSKDRVCSDLTAPVASGPFLQSPAKAGASWQTYLCGILTATIALGPPTLAVA